MSKASKVSHFHSTTFSAHRSGRVDPTGRPMTSSSAAGAPGTVGAPMSPKFTAQAQCIAFLSPNETVQQYANRIAAGNIAAVGVRQLVLGGKLQIGIVEDLARKARKEATGSERGWGAVTAGQMFTAVNHQPPPAGMPIVTCGPGERAQLSWDQTSFGSGGGKGYSLQKRGTVTGVEDEPGTVGARAPGTVGCPPGTHDDGSAWFGEKCVPDLQSNGPQLTEVKETIDWIAKCNEKGGIYDPESKYHDPADPCFQCAKGMNYDWNLHDCVGTPAAPPPPTPPAAPTPKKPQGCEPGYSLIQNPKTGDAYCTQCVQEHNVLNWTTGDCTCESGFVWQDKADPANFKCVPKALPAPPPQPNCGPGTHFDGSSRSCVVDATPNNNKPDAAPKEEDNTWKWVAGIAAAAVVVGGGTYLAMKKKGKKSALPNSSSHSTQTDVS